MERQVAAEAEPLFHTTYAARNLPQPRVSKLIEVRGGLSSQHNLKPVTCLAWSCDGKKLATGSQERQIRIWDANGKFDIAQSRVLSGPSNPASVLGNIAALAFSPTDPDLLVATTKLSDKNSVIVWNTRNSILPVATFDLPANSLRIAFHPSGTQFAVVCEHGSRDQALFFWYGPYGSDKAQAWAVREDIHMGCTGIDLGVSLDEFQGFLFSHSGKVIFTGSANGGLNAWKFREEAPIASSSTSTPLANASVPLPRAVTRLLDRNDVETPNSPRSRTPVGDGEDEQTDRENGDREATPVNGDIDMGEARGVQSTDPTEDKTREQEPAVDVDEVAGEKVAENSAVNGEQSETANVDDKSPAAVTDAMEVDPAPAVATPADTLIASGAASPKEEEIAAETVDDLWAKQLQLLKQTPSHILNCYAIDLCPTGRFIATGGADAMVNLYRTKDWIGVKTFQVLPGIVDHLAFSHDGEYLAASGDDRTIYILSPHTGNTVARIPTLAPVACLAWSPLRTTLAFCTKSLTTSTSTSGWSLIHID